jgi:hypothetical protein
VCSESSGNSGGWCWETGIALAPDVGRLVGAGVWEFGIWVIF